MSAPGESRVSDWPEALIVLLLFALPAQLLLQVLNGLGAVPPVDTPERIQLSLVLQSLSCLAVLAWYLLRRRRPPLGRLSVWRTAGLYLLVIAVWYPFVWYAYPWILELFRSPLEPQPQLLYFVEVDFGRPSAWASLLAVAVVAPIAEEIVFRGYLYGVFKAAWGTRSALLLTSAVFGLIHSPQTALPLALLGLFFGWLRERSGGLAAPIMAHSLHNGVTVVAVVLFPSLLGG